MQATKVEWVSKEEAGVLLGTIQRPLSTRRVLELAREGRLESGRVKDPNSHQTVVRIHAGSIERFLELNRNPEPIPHPRGLRVRDRSADGTLAVSAHHLWLTLEEAADYSGLPASILLRMVTHAELPTIDVGVRPGGRWRVRRTDLDQIPGQLVGKRLEAL